MALKPNGNDWKVKEQIYEDLASGLTLKFESRPYASAPYKLTIYGDSLPFGNRDILFGENGDVVGGGTATSTCPAPSWLQEADPPEGE